MCPETRAGVPDAPVAAGFPIVMEGELRVQHDERLYIDGVEIVDELATAVWADRGPHGTVLPQRLGMVRVTIDRMR